MTQNTIKQSLEKIGLKSLEANYVFVQNCYAGADSAYEVPVRVLNPVCSWDDANAYEAKARELAGLFHRPFNDIVGDNEPNLAAVGSV